MTVAWIWMASMIMTYVGSTITESQPSIDLSNSAESQTNATVSPSTDLQMQKDVLIAVLRTFELMEVTNASQKSFMNILHFGRDMYCKGDQNMIRKFLVRMLSTA